MKIGSHLAQRGTSGDFEGGSKPTPALHTTTPPTEGIFKGVFHGAQTALRLGQLKCCFISNRQESAYR
jgi:hypothetical protein